SNANDMVNRFIVVTFEMKFAVTAVPQRLSRPSGGRQTARAGRRPEVEQKGEPRRLPLAVSRARKLEDDLTSKLDVAAPVKGCRNESSAELSLTRRCEQVGMVEDVVGFQAQLQVDPLRDVEVL